MKTLKRSILPLCTLTLVSSIALGLNHTAEDSAATMPPALQQPDISHNPALAKSSILHTHSIKAYLEIANAWLDTLDLNTTPSETNSSETTQTLLTHPPLSQASIAKTAEGIIAYLGSDPALIAHWLAAETSVYNASALNTGSNDAAIDVRYNVLYHVIEILQILATEQPLEALSIAQRTADKHEQNRLTSTVVEAWAAADAQSALNWLKSTTNENQSAHLHTVLSELLVADPALALIEIETLEDISEKNRWRSNYAMQLAETDPNAALLWADSLETESRYQARQASFNAWYWQSSDAALKASETLLEHHERAEFINAIAFDLPNHDLTMAQSVFDTGNDQTRQSMAYSMVQALYEHDPTGAATWVDHLSESEARTSAQISLVERFVVEQPEKVLPTLRQLGNEHRVQMMDSTIWDLAYSNRNLVESWLVDGTLSQSEQTLVEDILLRVENGEYPHGC